MPAGITPGRVFRDPKFYRRDEEWQPKFFVVLAETRDGDLVARLLTSQIRGQPENPRCYHGHPYSTFYLGVLGGRLGKKSWLDLRALDDLDGSVLARRLTAKEIEPECRLDKGLLADLIDCVATANDTTRMQENALRDQKARL